MGRKRHLLVDTQGFALKVVVSAADTQVGGGAQTKRLAHLRWATSCSQTRGTSVSPSS